jgi:hypothetical protein
MISYVTLIICLISAFIAGGLTITVWRILTEKDHVQARVTQSREQKAAPVAPKLDRPLRRWSNTYTGKCPVENCRIRAPHSHTEAFIKNIKR